MHLRSGFTFIELLIVFALLAIFAGFAAMVSAPAIRNAEFDRTRETIRQELVAAQTDTIGGTQDASWGVAFSSNRITRYRGASYATRNSAYDLVTTFMNGSVISGTADVPFTRPFGVPASAATVVITLGAMQATTTVSASGGISIR